LYQGLTFSIIEIKKRLKNGETDSLKI